LFESTENINFALQGTGKKVTVTGTGTFQFPKLTTTQRDTLTPEVGDVIYNITVGTIQVYVEVAAWNQQTITPIPGWVNLYTPPPEP
jgi:hypothetical protein